MQPDLSPHLHTKECNVLIDMLFTCYREHPIKKNFGECSQLDTWVWKCTKQERIWRRNTNPRYDKRLVELQRLPVEFWTPPLHKLKAEGKLDFEESNGCKI